jgi:very-short-patch-repair endonuclease
MTVTDLAGIRHPSGVPVPPRRPPELRGRVFRGSAVVAAGTLSPGELRSSAWRRLFRDVYACADLPVTHELRSAAAARLLVPGSVVSGRSAAVLWGLPLAQTDDDVELTVPPGSNVCRMPGLRLRRGALEPEHIAVRRGVRATTAEVTAVDLARVGTLEDAVVLIDRFVDTRATDLARVRAAAAEVSGRGCRQVRQAAALADGLAGSPQETRLRLLLDRSALPRPVAQFVVRDAVGFVARVDFAWPEAKVAVEYEGAWHGESPQQVAADRRRLNRLTAAGWTVVFVTAADLHHPEQLVARIAAELTR